MKLTIRNIATGILGSMMVAGISANVYATPATVTDVTDWGTTPMEVVSLNLPYLNYNGGVYAGINTLKVTENGNTFTASGFCIDPFHYSVDGPQPYNTIALGLAPKYPGPMGATTALQIEDLWAEYFPSAQTSASVAAGLQIAIWELVSESAAVKNGVPQSSYFSVNGANDYGAAADIASLATYHGQAANLIGLTGPGQDYVIPSPGQPSFIPPAPDGGTTLFLLGGVFAGFAGLRRKFGFV